MRTGQLEMQMSINELVARAEHEDWVKRARFVIADLCHDAVEFTAEDVRRMVGEPPAPNLIGALFRTIAEEGTIRQVGYQKAHRPEAHGRPIALWMAAA